MAPVASYGFIISIDECLSITVGHAPQPGKACRFERPQCRAWRRPLQDMVSVLLSRGVDWEGAREAVRLPMVLQIL